jgi:hypothetical protein
MKKLALVAAIILLAAGVVILGGKANEPVAASSVDRIKAACEQEYRNEGDEAVSMCLLRHDEAYLDQQAAEKDQRVKEAAGY